MKIYVGVTDNKCFDFPFYLAARASPPPEAFEGKR